ncbi:MAG: hypothetical protein JEY94_04465 [Melioribacteraceae bacterium]|nr:hypothetical protein [Melioribacteraceae bacterium]
MRKYIWLPIYFLSICSVLNAQVENNFDGIYGLIKSAAVNALENVHEKSEIKINAEFPDDFRVLKNRLIADLGREYKIIIDDENSVSELNFSVGNVNVNYSEPFRDGFLGSFITERKLLVEGVFFIKENKLISNSNTFLLTKTDTLEYDDLLSYENNALGFTKGNRPEEPMFSTLLEPAVVMGTAIVTVILFFTVRSN